MSLVPVLIELFDPFNTILVLVICFKHFPIGQFLVIYILLEILHVKAHISNLQWFIRGKKSCNYLMI